MLHHEHIAMIIIVGVRGIVGELLSCESRLTLLLLALYLIVVEFATISALNGIVLSAWFGMMAPHFAKCPSPQYLLL